MKIGCQLYSLRSGANTPEGLRVTLENVREIGYEYVQLSGICKCDPGFLREALAENGLKAVVCHVGIRDLTENLRETLDYYDSVGCGRIGIGALPAEYRGTEEAVRNALAALEPALCALNDRGQKLYFHNHAFDFERFPGGGNELSIIAGEPRISLLLDVYWVQMGGFDVSRFVRACKGKCDIVHFKDWEIKGNTPRFAPVGRGNLDWAEIYAACDEIGVKYAFVEQDEVYGDDTPIGCVKESFENMKKFGWIK